MGSKEKTFLCVRHCCLLFLAKTSADKKVLVCQSTTFIFINGAAEKGYMGISAGSIRKYNFFLLIFCEVSLVKIRNIL